MEILIKTKDKRIRSRPLLLILEYRDMLRINTDHFIMFAWNEVVQASRTNRCKGYIHFLKALEGESLLYPQCRVEKQLQLHTSHRGDTHKRDGPTPLCHVKLDNMFSWHEV